MAVAALVVGILALLFTFVFPPLGIVLGIAGLVFGLVGRSRASRNPAIGRGTMAMVGVVLSVIALLLSLLFTVLLGFVIAELFQQGENLEEVDPQELQRQLENQLNQ